MFDFIKNLFVNKPAQEYVNGDTLPVGQSVACPSQPAAPAATRSRTMSYSHGHGNGSGVHISLQAVLSGLPLELKGRLRQTEVGDATISIPLERVLSQLASGAVKIPFGDLRRAAPQIFSKESDRDQIQVPLPLNEILERINPALLIRRPNQKPPIEVPEEINSPFGQHGDGLIFSAGPAQEEAPVAPRAITPATPAPGVPTHPRTVQPIAPQPSPLPPAHQPAPIQMRPAAPAGDAPQQPSAPAPIPFRRPVPSTPAPAPRVAAPAPSLPGLRNVASRPAPIPPSPPAAPAPAPAPAPATPVHSAVENPDLRPASETLLVPLTALAENWPEALRQEIVQLNLVDAKVALPVETVEEALKRGKVAFPWRTLRSWIKPAPLPAVSAHDAALLELPLKVVAPLFVLRQKESGRPQAKTEIDENIPNLFFGFPQTQPATADAAGMGSADCGVAKPVDTNYYVWDDAADSARVDETEFKRRPTPGTTFITRYATPNEVVSRAAALEGVAGALIALPDGLMVASRLASDLNGETLAAFLPHIFGKVSQCTKELRMGDLNNLNFTVGNVPWKIFRVNAIFFAAFGEAGQALPTSQLAALAAELDRKKQ